MKMEMDAKTEPTQLLPDDLVLEIVARCPTVAAVIRCAATSKSIRRGILHAAFLRQLRCFLLRNGGDDDGHVHHPCIPSLLLGLYHQVDDPHSPPAFVPADDDASYPPSVVALPLAPDHDTGDHACDFGPYMPVVSRRSLLVLRQQCKIGAKEKGHLAERHGVYPVELSVCNPTTGERWVLPPHDAPDTSLVLLEVDPLAPSSFKLLIAELSWRSPMFVQIFSSQGGGDWGPAMACPVSDSSRFDEDYRPKTVVVDDTVHWLCRTISGNRVLDGIITWRWRGDSGGAPHKTSLMKLPPKCESAMGDEDVCLAALPSADETSRRLLSVILLDLRKMVVWVRAKPGAGWVLRHLIMEEKIARQMGFEDPWLQNTELPWFCEGSGALFLRERPDGDTSPLLLRLDSKAALLHKENTTSVSKLEVAASKGWDKCREDKFCPYED